MDNETYLGDAVYVSFDGWMLKLRTDDGNNQVIYLEPQVYGQLERYVESLREKRTSESENAVHE